MKRAAITNGAKRQPAATALWPTKALSMMASLEKPAVPITAGRMPRPVSAMVPMITSSVGGQDRLADFICCAYPARVGHGVDDERAEERQRTEESVREQVEHGRAISATPSATNIYELRTNSNRR